jgi:hypothetical protein
MNTRWDRLRAGRSHRVSLASRLPLGPSRDRICPKLIKVVCAFRGADPKSCGRGPSEVSSSATALPDRASCRCVGRREQRSLIVNEPLALLVVITELRIFLPDLYRVIRRLLRVGARIGIAELLQTQQAGQRPDS